MPAAVTSPKDEPVLWPESELLSEASLLLLPLPPASRTEESLPSASLRNLRSDPIRKSARHCLS
jgi:hypothetical protein